MNNAQALLVVQYVNQITALNASIAATTAALSTAAPLINVQLAGQIPIDLSQIGLTPAQTATILNSLQTFLQGVLTTATNNLVAVP